MVDDFYIFRAKQPSEQKASGTDLRPSCRNRSAPGRLARSGPIS